MFIAQLSQRLRCLYNRYLLNKSYRLLIYDPANVPHLEKIRLDQDRHAMYPPQKFKMDGQDLTTMHVDLIQMDDFLADGCDISPTTFLLHKT